MIRRPPPRMENHGSVIGSGEEKTRECCQWRLRLTMPLASANPFVSSSGESQRRTVRGSSAKTETLPLTWSEMHLVEKTKTCFAHCWHCLALTLDVIGMSMAPLITQNVYTWTNNPSTEMILPSRSSSLATALKITVKSPSTRKPPQPSRAKLPKQNYK